MRIFHKSMTLTILTLALSSCNFLAEGINGTFGKYLGGGSIVVMVDPYLQGATMCHDVNLNGFCDPDEPESSPSDSKGNTQFAINLPSNAKLIQKQQGTSNGKAFLGTLKTDYDPNFIYVTPITTMLANGLAVGTLLSDINSVAGTSFSTINDLKINPMAAIEQNDPSKLVVLKASMAITSLLASNPNRATIAGAAELTEKYTNINHVIGNTVPDQTKLSAAVVVQEYISNNAGSVTGLDVAALVNQINSNPGKEIRLTGATTVGVFNVSAPNIVKLANTNHPFGNSLPTLVVGGVNSGDSVTLYADSTCTVALNSGTTSSGTSVNVPVTIAALTANNGNNIYAKASNTNGTSPCSTAYAYFYYDTTAPTLALTPSFAPDGRTMAVNNPTVSISLSAAFTQHDQYELFLNNSCVGPISIRSISTNAVTNITFDSITLPTGNHNFYVRGKDLAGNMTACHSIGTQMIDVTPPARPSAVVRLTPASSPSNVTNLQIRVDGVESTAKAFLYADHTCTTYLDEMFETGGNSVTFSRTGLGDGVHTFSSRVLDGAGNLSACSLVNLTHVVDTTPPAMVTNISRSNPTAAVSSNQYPTFLVTGVNPTDTVRIYNDAACTSQIGMAVATTNSALVNSQILSEGYHQIKVMTSDLAGNFSPCTSFFAEYTVDTIAPVTISSMNMHVPNISIGNNTTPTILVNGVENGATVKVFRDASCSQQVGSIVATTNPEYVTTSVLTAGNYTFYARQTDVAGNNSACSTVSVNYVLDTTPPSAPVINWAAGTSSPSGNTTPTLAISNLEIDSNVEVFTDAGCTNLVSSGAVTMNPQNFLVDPLVTGGPNYTFYTRVTDNVGNMRACTNSNKTYTLSRNLTGVAAIGGPLRNAEITIYGANNCRQNIGSSPSGVYNFTNVTCSGPYLIKAQNVAATLYSVATEADLGGTVNITPLTELVMNRVYPSINYGSEAAIDSTLTALNSTQAAVNSSIVAEKAAVKTALADLFNGFSLSAADIIKTPFSANGSGMDALLNSITVAPYPASSDYAMAVKTTTTAPMIIPVTGTITDTLTSPGVAPTVAADFNAIKSVLNSFDGCPIGVTSYPSATVQNCINSYTHVDFMHDGNNREDFALGISEEYVDFDLLVQFTDYHLMDMYSYAGDLYAEVMTYVSDYDVSTNPHTLLYSYVESYKMIKVSGVWKVYGNQLPFDLQAMPSKISANSTSYTGYEITGGFNDPSDTLHVSMADGHLNGTHNFIEVTEANYNGYQHINVESGPARAGCASTTVHCNNFFTLPTGLRRPNFLKVDLQYYDGITTGTSSLSIMLPSYKDISNNDYYATFTGLPSPLCGTNINLPSFAINSMPGMYSVMGWNVGPTTSTPLYIDYANMDWWNTSSTMNLLYWDGTNPSGSTTTDFSEVHATVYISTPGGERRATNVSCGYP